MNIDKLPILKLNNTVASSVYNNHPWIFSGKIKKESKKFKNGDFVRLKDSNLKTLGFGIFSSGGLIGIRVIHFGLDLKKSYFNEYVKLAVSKRLPLLKETNSIRWIHGENDFIPGVTVDGHGDTLTIMYYSDSLKMYARYIGYLVYKNIIKLGLPNLTYNNILLKLPTRIGRNNGETKVKIRVLRGSLPTEVKIQYKSISFELDPTGQKGGIYNDIRNLRRFIFDNNHLIKSTEVLNLFSSNGLLSICLEKAGASLIYSMDSSELAIATHRKNISPDNNKHIIFKEDIFKNIEKALKSISKKFDIIIIDPPSLTSSEKDKSNARQAYKFLIKKCIPYLVDRGILIMASCSNRIHENDFERICKEALEESDLKYKYPAIRLKPEIDHPVIPTFPEGAYFKVHIYDLSRIQ